ncbi:MAG: DnaD domain protein [Anaerolineaceae bacterium]
MDTDETLANGFKYETGLNLNLPADFAERICSADCQKDCVILLLTMFQLLGNQERPTWILDAYLLADAVKPSFAGSVDRYEIALAEALDAQLLLAYTEFRNPGLHYLIPATPAGLALYNHLLSGETSIRDVDQALPVSLRTKPNLYELYEQNIGILTPMIADQLKLDEAEYPHEWIVEAVDEAVQHNVRNWKYVSAILKNWKDNGRGPREDRPGDRLDEFRRLWQEQKDNER